MSTRRIVCAALRSKTGDIICGPRHFDQTMIRQIELSGLQARFRDQPIDQGFIDQLGVFLSREEAWVVASKAGQIIRRVGGDGIKLYSENLY